MEGLRLPMFAVSWAAEFRASRFDLSGVTPCNPKSSNSVNPKPEMGVSENRGTLFGGPYNKDPANLG